MNPDGKGSFNAYCDMRNNVEDGPCSREDKMARWTSIADGTRITNQALVS